MPPTREVSREAVLEAALDIVRGEGLGAVTARSVAARLRCSTQPIYSLFAGMKELVDAAYARAQQEALAAIQSFRPEGVLPELQPVLGFYNLAREQPHLYRAVFLSGYAEGPLAMAQLGPAMLAEHLPKSSRLRSLDEQGLGRVARMVTVFVAGLGLLSAGGDIPPDEAMALTEAMYRMAVADELSALQHRKKE